MTSYPVPVARVGVWHRASERRQRAWWRRRQDRE